MRTSPTTTPRKKNYVLPPPGGRLGPRSGFTLIEVMIVMAIMALMAVMVLPRGFFFPEPPFLTLRRAVAETSELALNGRSVRFRMEAAERTDKGRIVVEELVRAEDLPDSAAGGLEWKPARLLHHPEGEEWSLSPEIIYFYSDGSCTPARFTHSEGESALLTVTGFLFEVSGKPDGV